MFENVESKWIITNFVKKKKTRREIKTPISIFFNQTTSQVKIIGVLYIQQ